MERKKLNKDHNDAKRELRRLKKLCADKGVDTSTRKQQKEVKREQREQRAAKGDRPVNNSRPTASATAQPASNDEAAGVDP